MKLFGLISGAAAVSEGITQYNDKNGNVVTIDPGCPTLWPKNQDSDTVLPYWKKECPPIDLCYPNIRQKQAIKPYSKNCKVDGANAPDASCCSKDYKVKSYCYGICEPGTGSNLDGKTKMSWKCSCSQTKGCWWVVQGTDIQDMVCTSPCIAAKKLDWNTSARKQADFNSQESALGVNGKILSAGWFHKWSDNNWAETGNYYLVLSIQGVTLDESNVMAWDWDVKHVISEGFGANQHYTFAQTLIVLEPNSATPTGPWKEGDIDNVLVGIENHDDFTQANIDSGRVAYSVGIIYDKLDEDGNEIDFECTLSHFGANPKKNDVALKNSFPDLYA